MTRFFFTLALCMMAAPLGGQVPVDLDLGVHAGRAWIDRDRYSPAVWGGLSLAVYPRGKWEMVGLRLDAMLLRARHSYIGKHPWEPDSVEPRLIDYGHELAPVARAVAVVRQRPRDRPTQLFVFGGYAYSDYPWLDHGAEETDPPEYRPALPPQSSFGVTGGVGLNVIAIRPSPSVELSYTTARDAVGRVGMVAISVGVVF